VRKTVLLATLGAAAALAVAASALAAAAGPDATPQRVTVGMTEFKFALAPKTVKKNVATTFTVTNKGSIGHDFKIAGKKTPVLAAGKKGTLKVTFKKAGRYPYLCTLPSHAAAGMKGVLVVK
jgi:plastocyanin